MAVSVLLSVQERPSRALSESILRSAELLRRRAHDHLLETPQPRAHQRHIGAHRRLDLILGAKASKNITMTQSIAPTRTQ